jgi:hypothetical protein
MEIEKQNPLYIYFIIQFIFFILQQNCFIGIETFQYVEMIFGSLFIIFVFGILGNYVFPTQIPDLLRKSILVASLFSIWYYITKWITNMYMKDKNGNIHW